MRPSNDCIKIAIDRPPRSVWLLSDQARIRDVKEPSSIRCRVSALSASTMSTPIRPSATRSSAAVGDPEHVVDVTNLHEAMAPETATEV